MRVQRRRNALILRSFILVIVSEGLVDVAKSKFRDILGHMGQVS